MSLENLRKWLRGQPDTTIRAVRGEARMVNSEVRSAENFGDGVTVELATRHAAARVVETTATAVARERVLKGGPHSHKELQGMVDPKRKKRMLGGLFSRKRGASD